MMNDHEFETDIEDLMADAFRKIAKIKTAIRDTLDLIESLHYTIDGMVSVIDVRGRGAKQQAIDGIRERLFEA